MIAANVNGSYNEITQVFAGGDVQQEIIKIWASAESKWVYEAVEELSGALPLTFHADGSALVDYQVWGNTGGVGEPTENLLEITQDMYNPENWDLADPYQGTVYFMYYRLPQNVIEHLQNIGTIAGTVYLKPNGSYDGEVLAITNLKGGEGTRPITNDYRLLTTNGLTLNFNKNVSEWNDIYLALGFSGGIPQDKRILIDELFQNYNIMLNAGNTALPYVPFGYELDMNVRSLNIYNAAETSWSADGTILNDAGEPISSEGSHYTTNFIPVEPGEVYYLAGSLANETRWRVYFYDSNKNWIRRTGSKSPGSTRVIAMDENASYFQLQVGTDIVSTSDWNFVHSRTAPEKYQTYFNTVTPIYIGSDPLGEDEYIDCQAGKIYRMINGTLTPTDPPVPLPALPTCEGMTIVDYDSTPAPSSAYLKYKKGW